MAEVLKGLKPEKLWELFSQISRIPHGSKNEEALGLHLRKTAENEGFAVAQDDVGNLCVSLPATAGYEKAPTLILQAHLDMVCEKNEAVDFDFLKDPLTLIREGDWIKADGTTLGADNGIGVAAALGVALSHDVVHGPLEILLTVDEETGLTGAMRLDPSLVTGELMINLDSEKTGAVCLGCAGGGSVNTYLPLKWVNLPEDSAALELSLTGLQGGHSGLDIHENRGNAIKLMTRTLRSLTALDVSLSDFRSGDKINAIPRECSVGITLPSSRLSNVSEIINDIRECFYAEFPHESQLLISYDRANPPLKVLHTDSFKTMLDLLLAFPHGVVAMSRDISGLVETSNNLSSAHIKGDRLKVHNTPRSSLAQSLQTVINQIVAVSDLAGAEHKVGLSYPGWRPDPDSQLLHLVEETHRELFGEEPKREATHAGLECGVIGEKLGGIDMISIGPDMVNCHSPDEAVSIASVEKFWRLITGVLAKVAVKGTH